MTVVYCSWGDFVEGGGVEALTLARSVAEAKGQPLHWLVMGAAAKEAEALAGRYGVAAVDVIEDGKLAGFGTDAVVAALHQYCQQAKPSVVFFNQNARTRPIAPLLAGRLGAPVVMNAFAIAASGSALELTATAFGGDTHVVYRVDAATAVVAVVTTSLRASDAAQPTTPAVNKVAVDLATAGERFRVVASPKAEGPRLEDADIIVSGGRGLGSAQNYELVKDLAGKLNGMYGASRAIVDDGWIDSSRQVGLTGKITRPGLYVAVGISGASQHMAGCSAAKTIVAINRDADASIFRYARYGIVGDCLEVVPELIKAAGA